MNSTLAVEMNSRECFGDDLRIMTSSCQQPKKRNVLMILYWFPPSNDVGSFRALKFINQLSSFNWYPVVLAPLNGVYYSQDCEAESNIKDKCTIYRTSMFDPFSFLNRLDFGFTRMLHQITWRLWNRIAIPDGAISWILPSVMPVMRIINDHKIEVVYATGNPFSTFILAALINRTFKGKVKLVIDYRDPWTLNPFIRHSIIRAKFERIIERFVLKHIDAAIFTTEDMRDLQKHGFMGELNEKKLHAITNSYEETIEQSISRHEDFVIVHAGNFYGNRGPDKFLEGLSIASERSPVLKKQAHVFFYGIYDEKKLISAVDKFGLNGMVTNKGRIPQSELLPILKAADVLLLINSSGPGHHVFIPAKFFDYLKVKRPILCLAEEGALCKVIRKTQSGVIVDPGDAIRIADAILTMFDFYYLKEKDFLVSDVEIQQFNSAYTTKQLSNIFNEVCRS